MKKLGQLILWQRVHDYLRRYRPMVIGVAGSTGKTIAKEAITLALQENYRVRSAPYSYNTPIGVAMSVLGVTRQILRENWMRALVFSRAREAAAPEPEILVLELGADRPGDIDFISRKLAFKIGVITNVQSTHLRLFTNKEYVAHEMESLAADIPKDGTLILNADDPLVAAMAQRALGKVLFYGQAETAQVRLLRVKRRGEQGFACEVAIQGKFFELHLPHLVASYHVPHVLAGLAAAMALNCDLNKVIKKLQLFVPFPGRMRMLSGYNGSKLLDDSYNASPESTLAALDTLGELSGRRKIAIIGDMLDLGAESLHWHEEIGKRAAKAAQVLVTVGTQMRHAGVAALKESKIDVHHFEDSRDVGKWLIDYLHQGDLVLIKGSRDMRMEEVTRRLLANPADEDKLVQ